MENSSSNTPPQLTDSELKLQNAFLHELSNVTVEMLNESDINELFQRIAEKLLHLSGGCYAYIAIENESGDHADIKYFASQHSYKARKHLTPNQGIGGTAWAQKRVMFTSQYQDYYGQLNFPREILQACAIPISCKLRRGGVLCILYDNYDIDVEAQLPLLSKFENIVAAALDNTWSHQRQKTELSMLDAMMKINQAISETNEYREILDSICDLILEGFNANRARVYRYNDGKLEGLAGRILTAEKPLKEALPLTTFLAESTNMWTVKHLQAAHVRVNTNDNRESTRIHEYRRINQIGCSYIVPLIINGEAWGVLSVHKPIGESDFTNSEKRLIDLLSSQLSVTIKRQRLMLEIEYQANHDRLTGCVNRTRFEKILGHQVTQADLEGKEFSLLFVDLDGFKNINDTMGHAAGDSVLVDISNKIKKLVDNDVSVARLGGDEFAILSPVGSSREQAMALGRSIAGQLFDEDSASTALLNVNSSVGIARYPRDGNTASELTFSADIAMYHAKGTDSGEVREYDAEFGARYTRRLKLRNRIENGLENDEFELHYQPKVRTSDGRVVGVEALIRWNEPEFASVSPAEWIPLAEENGMIHRIGGWVTENSIKFLQNIGVDLKISVNISATQFDAPNFPQRFLDKLERSGTPGSLIEFEITETAVIKDIDVAVAKLQQIREYGISIAIDDFGVEYSSLAYLGDLPIDVVKIDRIFVQRMDSDTGCSMIEPILRLAQSLGLETVVEGVETEQQKAAVIALGCDQIQGYYYSKPVPFNELAEVIDAIHSLEPQLLTMTNSSKRNAA